MRHALTATICHMAYTLKKSDCLTSPQVWVYSKPAKTVINPIKEKSQAKIEARIGQSMSKKPINNLFVSTILMHVNSDFIIEILGFNSELFFPSS